jgi:adenosylcobyric acid synthase
MNPILIKPEGNARSQVIVMGRPWRRLVAGEFYQYKEALWPVITAALDHLRAAYELVVIEGAGSPAELNLRAGDLVNMAVARHARAPVLLVGDIDRGGIFAQLLGTVWLLPPEERALVRGLVVNKFRGDLALFAEGVCILEARSELPVLGVVPFIPGLHLPEEDSATLDDLRESLPVSAAEIDIAIIRLPCIANFDDFSPLAAEDGVSIRYVSSCATLGRPHAVVLPGTKSTVADLIWLRQQGLAQAIKELASTGIAVVGICGGYQILGRSIQDAEGVESPQSEMAGLALLSVDTIFERVKATHQVEARILDAPGWLSTIQGKKLQGYEIHMGRTSGQHAWLDITRRSHTPLSLTDGAVDATGRVWGCYLHGLFANQALRWGWLASLGWSGSPESPGPSAGLQGALDSLAAHVETSLDMQQLEAIIWDS